jgi:hypothetical protein
MKTIGEIKGILAEHKEDLQRKFKVNDIGLFGSYVKKTQSRRSDVDILVDFQESISLLDLVKLENFLTSLLEVKVDLVPKEDIRRELKEIILKEAIYV